MIDYRQKSELFVNRRQTNINLEINWEGMKIGEHKTQGNTKSDCFYIKKMF